MIHTASDKVGPLLRRLRLTRGLGQGDVARRAGLPQAQISRIERGQANPTEKALLAISRALGARLLPVPFENVEEVLSLIRSGTDTDPGDVFEDVFIPDPEN